MDPSTTSATPGGSAAMMGPITTAHLILITLLAILTIIAIFYGMRLKRRRKEAEAAVEEQQQAVDAGAPSDIAPPSLDPPHTPATAAQDEPIATNARPAANDITRLKGLGPKLAATLAEQGITRLDQIAILSRDQASDLDARLGTFAGRLTRDRWVDQARLLTAGDTAAYEAQFGKLGS